MLVNIHAMIRTVVLYRLPCISSAICIEDRGGGCRARDRIDSATTIFSSMHRDLIFFCFIHFTRRRYIVLKYYYLSKSDGTDTYAHLSIEGGRWEGRRKVLTPTNSRF